MATQAQIIANQANSQKSSGPVTDEGKAKSSRNRLSHGFASSTRFIEGENPEQFNALLNDLIDEHQPATPTQQILVEMMAHNRWISLRAARIQGDVLNKILFSFRDVVPTLPLLIRYHTTAERAFHKAHAELLKTQNKTPNASSCGTDDRFLSSVLHREIGFESLNAPQPAEVVAEAAPESVDSAPKPPAQPAKPTKPAPSPAPELLADSDFASMEEEMEWVMNASIEEIRASGF
jgi:hypothetical protein